jgi:hypothetical protein
MAAADNATLEGKEPNQKKMRLLKNCPYCEKSRIPTCRIVVLDK